MLEVNRFGEVTRFRMCVPVEGANPYWVAAYLVDGLLVDTGCALTVGEFLAALEAETAAAGRRPDPAAPGSRIPRLAVNTHYHEDHVAANRALQDKYGLRVLAHPWAIPLIAHQPPIPWYRLAVWGQPEPSEVEPIGSELATPGGRHRFRVVDTPGHCSGHVSLVEPEAGWCFTGDLYTGERPRVVWREIDAAATIASLRRVVEAGAPNPGDRLVAFTAQGPVVSNARQAFLDTAAYLEDLVGRAGRLAADGLSFEDIRQALFGRESSFAALTEGEFSTAQLTRALLDAAAARGS